MFRDHVIAWGARLGLALFRAMPLAAASDFGGWLGRHLGPLFKVHQIAARNLARAMPELSEEQRKTVLRGMWDNLGRVVGEYAHLADINIDAKDEPGSVVVTGLEHFEQLRASGKPVIFISAHFGNWEVMSLVASRHGFPLVHVYRAANNPFVEEILQELRKPVGGRHIPKGTEAARELIRALKRTEYLGMLVDQKLNNGIAVPFFGRDAMTTPAPAEFALKAECPVVMAHVERLGGARFRVVIDKPIHFENTGDRERDVYNAMLLINRTIEGWIRQRPDHWFWVHKRWPKGS